MNSSGSTVPADQVFKMIRASARVCNGTNFADTVPPGKPEGTAAAA